MRLIPDSIAIMFKSVVILPMTFMSVAISPILEQTSGCRTNTKARTETEQRATIAKHNIRDGERTRKFAENLRSGQVAIEVGRTTGVVERFLVVPGRGEVLPDIELEAAKAFVAVLEAQPTDPTPVDKVMLVASPNEAEWSAALLKAGTLALGRTGRTDQQLFDKLVSVALGSANRADVLTRFVLTGGKGIDRAEGLRFDGDILGGLDDLVGRHSIDRVLMRARCMAEVRTAAVGLAGTASPALSKIPTIAPVTGINPNHGRPGAIVILSGTGWPATRPAGVGLVFTSNEGTMIPATFTWSPSKFNPTQITAVVPSGVGVGPVGFVSEPADTGGNPAAGRAVAGAIERCLDARDSGIARRFANWVPPAAPTTPPAVQPGGANVFKGGPQITAAQPLANHEGDTVTITGHEFAKGDKVDFQGISRPSVFVSDVSLRVVVPAVPGGQQGVRVRTPTDDSSNAFVVQVLPTFTSLSRGQAQVGESVEVNGSGFNRDTSVTNSGLALPGASRTPMPTSFINSNTVRFTVQVANVPVGGDKVFVWVENPGARPHADASLGPLPLAILPPPLSGWADLHTHPMINLAFGGKLVHGGVDAGVDENGAANGSLLPTDIRCNHRVRPTTMAEALTDDSPSHAGRDLLKLICGDDLRNLIIHRFQDENKALSTGGYARGFPDFNEWPKWNDITHQKMWVEWIRRAKKGGLRVMVALATNNKTLGDAVSKSGDLPTDDKASADLQLTEIKEFVGRHRDFMEIALGAADIERIVRNDKIAVVLGVELDHIGNFNNKSPLAAMSGDAAKLMISTEIQRLYDDGVRYIFPVHLLDNLFGGTAIYANVYNTSNRREMGEFWNIECADVGDDITHTYSVGTDLGATILKDAVAFKRLGINPFDQSGPGPVCPPSVQTPGQPLKSSGHRNARGLTPLGEIAIKEMMKRGMIIDIDHMSQKTADATLGLAEQFGYPLVSGHSGIRGTAGANAENSRTPLQLRRLSKLHGMFGLGSDGVHAPDWYRLYDQAITIMGSSYRNGAVAFGTDLNGLVKGPRPGGIVSGSSRGVVGYDATFPMSSSGTKAWDYNTEGVAHYGMLPDFIAHVRSVSGDSNERVNRHLFRSADYFWHMWEQIEAQRINPSPTGP